MARLLMSDDVQDTGTSGDGLSREQFTQWLIEIEEQPAWRVRANREAEYYDGNQLDSAILQKQRAIGLPPAIEPLIGPTIDSVLGAEAKSRTDWRVIADGDKDGDDVAQALNFKLNQAERHAQADKACSAAYAEQIKVGIGWVGVSRDPDPFKFPLRCDAVSRNEIWWDFLAKPDLSDARYLIRRRWNERGQAKLMFPEHADLIEHAGSGWQSIDPGLLGLDGGIGSTDLAMSLVDERGWSIEDQQWRDTNTRRVCLYEVWYRQWMRALVMRTRDGRVVEVDRSNPVHLQVLATRAIVPIEAVISKVRLAWWMGPHRLADVPSPYRHRKFPYVPFWGKREDRTGVPYALIRGMMYLQDEVNARISKMQWGLSAVRTTRTKHAVVDDDNKFRQEIARPDADVVLDAQAMQQGGIFRVERDFELNRQQYDRLVDAREGIKRMGGIYNAFMGQTGEAKSGNAIAGLVEQSNQTIADINDNFKDARSEVGDLLLSLLVEDLIGKREDVIIAGGLIQADKTVSLNVPAVDADTGLQYLDNDVERTKLKVTLSDVPNTPSFRSQQLGALSEAFKSAPPEYQRIMMPHLLALMDVPDKEEIIQAIKEADQRPDPNDALIDAKVKVAIAQAVKTLTEAQYAAMQAGQVIASNIQVAPVADEVMKNAGYQDPIPAGADPNFPQGQFPQAPLPQAAISVQSPDVMENTSPQLPPVPRSPMAGIETARYERPAT